MGRRQGVTKKNHGGKNDEEAQLKDQSVNQNPSSVAKDGTASATRELTIVTVEDNRSLQKRTPTRRSQRLQNIASPSQDFGIQRELGHVDVLVLEDVEGRSTEADQDSPQIPDVQKKESEEIKRLCKLLEEQQIRIDELAAGKTETFSSEDISKYVIKLEEKVNKYKNMHLHAQKKIRGLQHKNTDLSNKLARSNGILEGYEKGQQVFCGLIDSLKDASLFATLAKTTETGNTSGTPKRSAQTNPQAAKRKKVIDL